MSILIVLKNRFIEFKVRVVRVFRGSNSLIIVLGGEKEGRDLSRPSFNDSALTHDDFDNMLFVVGLVGEYITADLFSV